MVRTHNYCQLSVSAQLLTHPHWNDAAIPAAPNTVPSWGLTHNQPPEGGRAGAQDRPAEPWKRAHPRGHGSTPPACGSALSLPQNRLPAVTPGVWPHRSTPQHTETLHSYHLQPIAHPLWSQMSLRHHLLQPHRLSLSAPSCPSTVLPLGT